VPLRRSDEHMPSSDAKTRPNSGLEASSGSRDCLRKGSLWASFTEMHNLQFCGKPQFSEISDNVRNALTIRGMPSVSQAVFRYFTGAQSFRLFIESLGNSKK